MRQDVLVADPRELRAPLFVKPDEPLFIFSSAERARRSIEWQDIEGGAYRGFDADGRPFLLEAVIRERKPLFGLFRRVDGEVVLRVLDDPPEPDALRALIVRALRAVESTPPEALETLPLADLQATAVDRYGIE